MSVQTPKVGDRLTDEELAHLTRFVGERMHAGAKALEDVFRALVDLASLRAELEAVTASRDHLAETVQDLARKLAECTRKAAGQ